MRIRIRYRRHESMQWIIVSVSSLSWYRIQIEISGKMTENTKIDNKSTGRIGKKRFN